MNNRYDALSDICTERRSCRSFSSDDIPADHIRKIISLAKTSPYAGGRKNWDIITVDNKNTITRLSRAIQEEAESAAALIEEENRKAFLNYSRSFYFFEQAPVLLVPVFRVSPIMKALFRDKTNDSLLQWERDNSVKSISCVAMLILLAAESLKLGSCYMTGPLIAAPQISQILEIPSGRDIAAIIPVGYPSANNLS
jgi:nitroreductase